MKKLILIFGMLLPLMVLTQVYVPPVIADSLSGFTPGSHASLDVGTADGQLIYWDLATQTYKPIPVTDAYYNSATNLIETISIDTIFIGTDTMVSGHPSMPSIDVGTAEGQILYWDNGTQTYKPANASNLKWTDATQVLSTTELVAEEAVSVGEAAPDDTEGSVSITGDADSDAGNDVTEKLTFTLVPNADPTAALWTATMVQAAGIDFVMPLIASTLTSDGALSAVNADLSGTLTLSKGSQNYLFTDRSTALAIQGQTAGTGSTFEFFNMDGDGTDGIDFNIYGLGSVASPSDRERLQLRGLTNGSNITQFEIFTEANGSGTLRPLVLYTEGNTDQLKLNTDGDNSMSGNLYIGDKTVLQDRSTGADQTLLQNNVYFDGSVWKYIETGVGSLMQLDQLGHFNIWTTPSGTAGNTATITKRMTVENTGGGFFYEPLTLGQSGGTSGQLNFVASDNDQGNLSITITDKLQISDFGGGVEVKGSPLEIDAAQAIYYDGGTNTYRHEPSDDQLDDVVGGTTVISQTPTGASELGYDLINNSELQNSLVGSYYNFDGVDDVVTVSDDANLDMGTNDFSLIVRFKVKDATDNDALIDKHGASFGQGYGLYLEETSGQFKINLHAEDGATNQVQFVNTTLRDYNIWYSYVATFDRSANATHYFNGVADGTSDMSGVGDIDNAGNFRISQSIAGDYPNCEIAFIGVVNRLLTATEIKEISVWDSENPPVCFTDVGANQTEQTSGTLTIGKRYRINDWITADDFTNIGGTNADGSEFIATGTTPTTWTNSSTVVPIGPTLNLNASGIGHNTWMDASGNDLFGTVSGATYTNIPASDIEEARQDGITTDTQILSSSNIVPDGYILKYVIGTETAGNTATLDLGTTAGASDVFSQVVFTASSTVTDVADFVNLTGADLPLYLNDDGAGTWNSGSMNMIFVLQKIR